MSFIYRTITSAAVGLVLSMAFSTASLAEKVITLVPQADLKSLDPIQTGNYVTRNHGYLIFDTLFGVDENLQPQPQMVDSYSVSDDGLEYTFTLREGLTWHDGSAVTPADCIASIQRWGARDGMGQQIIKSLDAFETVDDRTFKMKLKEPYGLTLYALGKVSTTVAFMMPERLAKTDPFEQIPEAIGSGPFRFEADEWVPGSRVVYSRNDDYVPRKGKPSLVSGGKVVNVDRVEWVYTPDQQTALNALLAGELDFIENPSPDLITAFKDAPGIKVEVLDVLGNQGWIRLNHLHPPFNDVRARRAILHIVDQTKYLTAIAGSPDFYRVCAAYFACGTPNEVKTEGQEILLNQDLEEAARLFKEAGYDGEPLVILHPTDIPQLDTATQVTAALLREAGITVELQSMDWSTLSARRAQKEAPDNGGWNIFHTWGVGIDVTIPPNYLGIASNCDDAWFGWPCDEKVEELRAKWANATDQKSRDPINIELQKRVYETVPQAIFGQWFNPVAYQDKLEGVLRAPLPIFWNVTKN